MSNMIREYLSSNHGNPPSVSACFRAGALAMLSCLVLVSGFLAAGFGRAEGKSYHHPMIEQTYRFMPDGSVHVEEIRTFVFDGSFSWANLRRETMGQYGHYSIEYEGVWDADSGEELRHEVNSTGNAEVIKWFYRAENITRRFKIRYRIFNGVQRYGDAAQFFWKGIEDSHERLDQVVMTLIPHSPSPGLFKVFVHGSAKPGELEFSPDFSRAVVRQSGIPEQSYVELRVLLDPAIFPRAHINMDETYESLLEDERYIVETARRETIRSTAIITTVIVILLILLALFIWTYVRYGREPRTAYDSEYEREPPRDLPPSVVPAIMTQSSVNLAQMPQAFAAAILECARLGYLEIHETEEKGLIFKHSDFIYKITAKGKALLSKQAIEYGRNERQLEEFETAVLRTIIRKAGDGSSVTGEEIQKWGKETEGGKTKFLKFVKPFGKRMRKWFESKYFKLDDPVSEKAKLWFVVGTVAVCAISFFIFFTTIRHIAFLVLGFGSIVLLPFSHAISRWSPEAALEEKRWKAYKKFISDFSAMKDAGPGLLPMWEEHLVYATALGVADKLLSNLKMVAQEYRQGVPAAAWYYPVSRGAGVPGEGLASLDSFSSSFSNLQNLSSALSSSTSSGGGFSGGGGGGGGGGSSGAG